MEGSKTPSLFDAKACGKLIAALASIYIFVNLAIVAALNFLRDSLQWTIFKNWSDQDLEVATTMLSSLLSPVLLMAVTLLALKGYFPAGSLMALFKKFGFERLVSKKVLLASFVVGVSMILFIKRFLISAYPPNPLAEQDTTVAISNAEFWVQLMFAVNSITFVPIAEEFVFRGVLYKGFMASWNKIIAAGAVCILFSLAHVDALRSGYWVTQLTLFFIPIVFITARELTGSLYSPILIHAGFNFGSVFIVFE